MLKIFFKALFRIIFIGLLVVLICGVVMVSIIFVKYNTKAKNILENSSSEDFTIDQGSTIYDSNGDELTTLSKGTNLTYLEYNDIPEDVINAFVAVEDQSFWSNNGIDLKGIIRVGVAYVLSNGEDVSGASTITQQLARNAYLTREVTLDRKLTEIFVAINMTKMYSKEEIIEYYVNDINYGNGIYGIQSAANKYFSKDADELTLSEIAYLCAIPNRPAYYNPLENPDAALDRRDKILGDMLEEGYITELEYAEAINETIELNVAESTESTSYLATYATDCAIRSLMESNGFIFEYEWDSEDEYDEYQEKYNDFYEDIRSLLYTEGYKIYTTLDTDIYEQAQSSLDSGLENFTGTNDDDGLYTVQGAMTIIDNDTNKVVAVVGGRSQDDISSEFNRSYQAYRQPGSSFKPLAVYTPALENGYDENSTLYDIDTSVAKNSTSSVIRNMTGTKYTLRAAVEQSINGCAWQLFDILTPSIGLSYVTDMQFRKICPNDYYDSAALGGLTYGVSTVEMASGYNCLINHGEYTEPTCIERICDSTGATVLDCSGDDTKQVYSQTAADTMVDILKGVVTKGTASSMNWYASSDCEVFGKTGTTNNNKDGWFCGGSSYYTIAVWVGCDTPQSVSGLQGATYPVSIWKSIMLKLTDGLSATTIDTPYYGESEDTEESIEEELEEELEESLEDEEDDEDGTEETDEDEEEYDDTDTSTSDSTEMIFVN